MSGNMIRPEVVEPKIAVKEVKKEDNTPKTEEKVLASKPIEIKNEKETKGFKSAPAANKEEENDNIIYKTEDILYLMYNADKDKRFALRDKWPDISSLFTTDRAFEARALSSMHLRLFADNIILVSSSLLAEVTKINKKKTEPALRDISKKVFGDDYYILSISDQEFLSALSEFKKGTKPTQTKSEIDFGEDKSVSPSTEFMNELLGK